MAEDPIDPKEPDIPNKPPTKNNVGTIILAAIIGGVVGYLICHFVADDNAAKEETVIERSAG